MTPSLWFYAIHGMNAEIIHLLEDNNIDPIISVIKDYPEYQNSNNEITDNISKRCKKIKEISYKELFYESIKCHQTDIINYFINNYLQKEDKISNNIFIQSLKYYNFEYIQKEYINEKSFNYLCQYDYYSLVDLFLKNKKIDINKKTIPSQIFKIHSRPNYSITFRIKLFNKIKKHIFQ